MSRHRRHRRIDSLDVEFNIGRRTRHEPPRRRNTTVGYSPTRWQPPRSPSPLSPPRLLKPLGRRGSDAAGLVRRYTRHGGGVREREETEDEADSRKFRSLFGRPVKEQGRGAYGKVFLYEVRETGEVFAVKKCRREHRETSQEYRERVRGEYRRTRKFNHENVLASLGCAMLDDEDGRPPIWSIAMGYCGGGTLYQLVSQPPSTSAALMSSAEVNWWFMQALRGVAYLHHEGLTHSDVKPDNMLITSAGQLKVCDFGFCQRIRRRPGDPMKPVFGLLGTRPYMAPEMPTRANEGYDGCAADAWACGIVFMFITRGGQARLMWAEAVESDFHFALYLRKRRTGFPPIDGTVRGSDRREVVYGLLHPHPSRRMTLKHAITKTFVAKVPQFEPPESTARRRGW